MMVSVIGKGRFVFLWGPVEGPTEKPVTVVWEILLREKVRGSWTALHGQSEYKGEQRGWAIAL